MYFCSGILISSILLGCIQSILRRCYRTRIAPLAWGIALACVALRAFSCVSRFVTVALASSAAFTLSSVPPPVVVPDVVVVLFAAASLSAAFFLAASRAFCVAAIGPSNAPLACGIALACAALRALSWFSRPVTVALASSAAFEPRSSSSGFIDLIFWFHFFVWLC